MDILLRILSTFAEKKQKVRLIVAISLLFAAVSTRMVGPYLTKILIDDVIGNRMYHLVFYILSAIIVLSAIRGTLVFTRNYLFEYISQTFIFNMRDDLYSHLHKLPFKFYDEHRIGEIMSRMTGDVEGVRNFLAGGAMSFMENVLFFTGSIAMLFYLDARLALAVLTVSPLLGFIAFKFDKVIRPIFSDIREQNAVLNTRTQENIAGIRVVKSFTKENHEKDLFDKENIKQLEKHITATYTWSYFFPLMDFISSLTPAILLVTGGALVVNGQMSLGTLVASTGYIWMITGPMRMLGFHINMLEQAITSTEKLFYYLDLGPSIKEKENALFPADFAGHLKFENVNLKYGDKEVLNNISFDLPPGKKLAIMGATGSGKTSIVNLIGRFYDCTAGKVTIDGLDVKDYKLKMLRKQLGYVAQETFLFSDTITENISFGNPDTAMDDVITASSIAQAHKFITQMPAGYETIVGERGIGLSGGEKQRIAIARALLKKPQILILDDATSSVDMETEFLIQTSLANVMKRKTTIVIAHRISSVKDADEIIVIDKGMICERGTHESLIERQGLYFRMYEDQYKDFDDYDIRKAEWQYA